jgi:hypothetical protein
VGPSGQRLLGGGGERVQRAGDANVSKGQAGRGNSWATVAAARWAGAASWPGWWPLRAGLGKGCRTEK